MCLRGVLLQSQTRGGRDSNSQKPSVRVVAKRPICSLELRKHVEVRVDTRTMAEEASVVEEGLPPSQTPLVSFSFERNVNWKQKYLEAEPKALGITQIGLSLFQIISSVVFMSKGLSFYFSFEIPVIILSLLVLIAGSLTIAAQNLHLPTLRACLGMQIVAVPASIANMIFALVKMDDIPYMCRRYYHYDPNSTSLEVQCHNIESTISHFSSECVVINVALVTISITVAAYCCKVTNCCSPAPKMPVITVQAPPAQL